MSVTNLGLIGHPLAHSLSPFIHQALMDTAGIQGTYRLYDIKPENLENEFPGLMQRHHGLNCTIPYKQAVVPLLSSLDQSAVHCQAVNTIYKQRGYNTDYKGFLSDCPDLRSYHVLILGAGGVSKTMAYAAVDSGAGVCIQARRKEQADQLAEELKSKFPGCDVCFVETLSQWDQEHDSWFEQKRPWALLNGTPAGLWPDIRRMPLSSDRLPSFAFVYDTIYNPVATRLVLRARSQHVKAFSGLGMLFNQALAAQKIWHPGHVFPEKMIRKIREQLAEAVLKQSPVNFLLTGFMGCGKSTIGQILSVKMGLEFIDLDEQIEKTAGQSIPDIFSEQGEETFRAIEHDCLKAFLDRKHSKIIATGGGAMIQKRIRNLIDAYPVQVIWINVPLEVISQRVGDGSGRPLLSNLQSQSIEALYNSRYEIYNQTADLSVDGCEKPEQIAESIKEMLGFGGNLI